MLKEANALCFQQPADKSHACYAFSQAGGAERYAYFKNVVAVPNASKTTLAWSFSAFGRSELWVALITFLYLDFLDATGTLFSMGEHLGLRVAGVVVCSIACGAC